MQEVFLQTRNFDGNSGSGGDGSIGGVVLIKVVVVAVAAHGSLVCGGVWWCLVYARGNRRFLETFSRLPSLVPFFSLISFSPGFAKLSLPLVRLFRITPLLPPADVTVSYMNGGEKRCACADKCDMRRGPRFSSLGSFYFWVKGRMKSWTSKPTKLRVEGEYEYE